MVVKCFYVQVIGLSGFTFYLVHIAVTAVTVNVVDILIPSCSCRDVMLLCGILVQCDTGFVTC